MARMPDEAEGPDEHPARRRRRVGARAVAGLVLVGAVVVLVFQNAQRVTLRFWFITAHVRLIWVIAASLAIGGALGLLASGRGRRSRRGRRRDGSSP